MNILNTLTIKHLTMNRKRSIVTIMGVILSTALMIGIGLLFSSLRDNQLKEHISEYGAHHAVISHLKESDIKTIKNYDTVKEVSFEKGIGFAYLKGSQNIDKPYLYINSVSNNFLNRLEILEGKLPSNDNEIVISDHIRYNARVSLKVGDTITLEVGKRYLGDTPIILNEKYHYDEEKLKVETTKEYKIVGRIKRNFTEKYDAAGFTVFTTNDNSDGNYKAYVEYKKIKDTRKKTEVIAKSLGLDYSYSNWTNLELVDYNETLLDLSGESKYSNFNDVVVTMMIITLSLISIACIIVIYNSFSISVMERKKQFGLFSSIGATRKQLRKTVFFEAFIVGIIGISLGVVSSLIGISVVLNIMNKLLTDVFSIPLELSIYPLFIIIPIIFMIIVIIISAHLPALAASRISPIKAIRLNDDIKIKSKKLRTPYIINKLFGVYGDFAYKSMKRNKKKYRITIISLFISVVLFITFSSYIHYIIGGANISMNQVNYDMEIKGEESATDKNKLFNEIKSKPGIKNTIMYSTQFLVSTKNLETDFTKQYKKANELHKKTYDIKNSDSSDYVLIANMDNDSYQKLKKKLKLKEDKSILINNFNYLFINPNSRKNITGQKFKDVSKLTFDVGIDSEDEKIKSIFNFSDLIELKELPEELNFDEANQVIYTAVLIVPNSVFKTIQYKVDEQYRTNSFNITFNYDDKKEVENIIKEVENNIDSDSYFQSIDIKDEKRIMTNIMIVIKILVYGFISLVTLIGITSVFNTINTSMALRKKEFAVLRSIGLSREGFNRILRFETLIFGIKSLIYSLPVSFMIIYIIHKSTQDVVGSTKIMLPWNSVIIAVLGVFVVTGITMIYTTKKIKEENILDGIRNENI